MQYINGEISKFKIAKPSWNYDYQINKEENRIIWKQKESVFI
jgi:hypothetical protein